MVSINMNTWNKEHTKVQKIKPDLHCEYCHGSGEVYDSVPYGMGNTLMASWCSCVEEQVDQDTDDIQLDLSEYTDYIYNNEW